MNPGLSAIASAKVMIHEQFAGKVSRLDLEMICDIMADAGRRQERAEADRSVADWIDPRSRENGDPHHITADS